MKIKPILFSTEMVKSILSGNKTQTRRILKPQPFKVESYKMGDVYPSAMVKTSEQNATYKVLRHPDKGKYNGIHPGGAPLLWPAKYQKDDILWVRETWNIIIRKDSSKNDFLYKAWYEEYNQLPWKPSIHMPKEAARIFLKVTNVRCERLHDISEDDAIAEGCSLYGPFGEYKGSIHPNGGGMRYRAYSTAKRAFQCIWETINCEESWKQNPFVWVYEFEVTEKPENFI